MYPSQRLHGTYAATDSATGLEVLALTCHPNVHILLQKLKNPFLLYLTHKRQLGEGAHKLSSMSVHDSL